MKAAAFQFDVSLADVPANLRTTERGLRDAAAQGVQLVVLPEMWPTSFISQTGPHLQAQVDATARAVDRMLELSEQLGLVVCGTGFAAGDDPDQPLNRLSVGDRGRLATTYDKVHLFSPTAEDQAFDAGRRAPTTVATSVARLAGVICYDLRFGEVTGVPARDGAEILVCPAQWPSARASHWRALAIGRAVENQCFVIACNRTGESLIGRRSQALQFPGNSIIVDPHGSVLAEGHGESGLVIAELDLALVAELRERIPIGADRRPALYRDWTDERSAT